MILFVILHIAICDIKHYDMKQGQNNMKPQDVVVLLKIIASDSDFWQQADLAKSLNMSQSEVSQCVARLKYSGLLDSGGKKVMRLSLLDFLKNGIALVFPQKPGAIVRGIPTAHSANPLKKIITSSEVFVWPSANGKVKGQAIQPLYKSIVNVVENDERFYQLLTLVDALRVGRAREKEYAVIELSNRILHESPSY
jgi:DNA-binding Lrp family transcriptional regulator